MKYENFKIDPTHIPYGRRDSWLGVTQREDADGKRSYITVLPAEPKGTGRDDRGMYLLPVTLMKDGREVSYEMEVTPVCAKLVCEYGTVRLCISDPEVIRLEAEGVDVRIVPALAPHEIAKDRGDGSWETCFHPAKILAVPLAGEMKVNGYFDVIASQMHDLSFDFICPEGGKAEAALHYYKSTGRRRASYPAFDDCVADCEKEFAAYMETVPELPERLADDRILAAYLVWVHIMKIGDDEYVYMNKGIHKAAFSWQQCYQAMAQRNNPQLAWRFLNSMFRFQDDFGVLPDSVDDCTMNFAGCKPPLHGVALQYLKKYKDFGFVPVREYRTFYEGLCRLVGWWMSYRDTDEDFMPQYDSADESGWDDASMFAEGTPAESADLSAYLVILMDILSEMAGRLGNTFEQKEWKSRSDRILKAMITELWDGEKFITFISGSHRKVESRSLACFLPLLLGDRLPEEIRTKLIASLKTEGRWLSPYGLAGEDMQSPAWLPVGWMAGPVLAPANLLTFLALMECGETDLAEEIACRYTKALHDTGFAMIINPKTGEDVSEGRWKQSKINRMSWTGAAFLIMGSCLKK